MERNIIGRLTVAVAATAVATLAACSSSSSDSAPDAPENPPVSGIAYNGPGSRWDVDLNDDGTFRITRRADVSSAVDLTVDGTYVRNGLGFLIMTVDSASGTDAPQQGDMAWAIEAEGYALMLYTDGDSFIPMVTAGTCPAEDFTGNWVIARKRDGADARDPGGDYFGSFAFEAGTGTGTLPARHSIADGFPGLGGTDLGAGSCADGIMQASDGVMYLTDNGGAIVHTNPGNEADSSFIFALTQKQLLSVAALDAEYAGILFDSSAASGGRISPVSIACSSGICSGQFVTDVVGMTTEGNFTVDLFGSLNAPVPGFVTGTVRDGSGNSGNLACMVDDNVQDSGQRMLSCVGQAPGNNARMFNLFFASN